MHHLRLFALALALCLCGIFTAAQAQWQPLNTPFGTNIYRVFETNGALLASSPTGIYRSDNSGGNWTLVDTITPVWDFIQVGNRIYAAAQLGLYTSDDGGQTWTILESSLSHGPVRALAFDGSALFAARLGGGLYYSTDNGVNWTADSKGLPHLHISSIAAVGSTVVISLDDPSNSWSDNGIYVRGTTGNWTLMKKIDRGTLSIGGTTLFVANWQEAYRSDDLGQTWTAVPRPAERTELFSFASAGSVLFAGSHIGGVYRSTDNGNTWTSSGLQSANVSSLIVRGNTLIAHTMWQGVHISHDGGVTWQTSNTGMKSTISVNALLAKDNALYATIEPSSSICKSTDGGATWSEIAQAPAPPGNGRITAIEIVNSTLLAGTHYNGIFTSDVNEPSWQASAGTDKIHINSLFQDDQTLLAGTYNTRATEPNTGIYISKDEGRTWTATDLAQTAYCFVRHNGVLYAGITRDIAKSSDGGEHWTIASPDVHIQSEVWALASNGSTLFAGSRYDGIYTTHDNGNTWQQSSNGLTGVKKVMGFAVHGQTVFAATDLGVFRTGDNGASWESVATGMGNITVHLFAIADGHLYAGTAEAALWRRPLSELITTSVADNTPEQFQYELLPHPVNSSSVLRLCSTCELHNATLTLSTTGGQRVRTTGNLYGTSVAIEKGGLAAGVYTFTLEEAGQVVTSGTIVIE